MQKPTLDYDDLFDQSQRKYADVHNGETATNVLMHHAVEGALRAYDTAEGRDDFLARIGSAKAQLGPREGEPTVISQEVLDILDAVKKAAETSLISWN